MPDKTVRIVHLDEVESGNVRIEMPSGMSIVVARVPLDEEAERTQLSVFINTEDMRADHFGGATPEMQIVLNDATLYDCEPDTEGIDKAKGEPPLNVETISRALADYRETEDVAVNGFVYDDAAEAVVAALKGEEN